MRYHVNCSRDNYSSDDCSNTTIVCATTVLPKKKFQRLFKRKKIIEFDKSDSEQNFGVIC